MLRNMSSSSRIDSNTCKYFVERKNRYCKLSVKKGREFCGEHLLVKTNTNTIVNEAVIEEARMKCPYDPTHTCYVSKLKKHLEICNSKPRDLPSYLKPKANIDYKNSTKIQSLNETPLEFVQYVINLINKIYKKLNYHIPEEILNVPCSDLDSTINASLGYSTRKHLIQISSILGHIQKLNFLSDELCFIEFGAGRGKLSYYLSLLLKEKNYKDCLAILIDKASHRHKYDNRLKFNSKMDLMRIKTNIANLILQNIPNITNYSRRIGLTKHLCGSATDLAIQCIIEAEKCEKPCYLDGIIFTLCCHFRCDWSTYVGKEFMKEIGITSDDFEIMTGIASWATCGFLCKEKEIHLESKNENLKLNLDDDEKKEIGKMCKFLIDYGRIKALEKQDFSCKLVSYVKEDVTLENVCLLATKAK